VPRVYDTLPLRHPVRLNGNPGNLHGSVRRSLAVIGLKIGMNSLVLGLVDLAKKGNTDGL
jgi:hypothetical protein